MRFPLLTVFSFLILALVSCNTDSCKDVDCGVNGTCEEGICACDSFYEGENCEIESRDKYLGTWTGEAVCDNGPNATGIVFEITPGVELNVIRIQSAQIYGNAQFLGTIFISGFGEEGVVVERFQVGINGFGGDIETIDVDKIRMTIISEGNGDACVFSLARG